jgi:tetratricopeptide (TPR) repeat protein
VSPEGTAADVAAEQDALAASAAGPARLEALLHAGQAWLEAGDAARALDRARVAAEAAVGPGDVARAELLLGRVLAAAGGSAASAAHLEAAAAAGRVDAPRVAAEALLLLVPPALFAGERARAEETLRAAGDRLDAAGLGEGDPLRRLHAAIEVSVALAAGRPLPVEGISAVIESVAAEPTLASDLSLVVLSVALPLVWLERYDAARAFLRSLVAGMQVRGRTGGLALPLCVLAMVDRRVGHPTRAIGYALQAEELASETDDRTALLFALSERANAHGLIGDIDRCRAAAERVLRSGTRGELRNSALSALATAEVWVGDPGAAVELLEPILCRDGALAPSVTLFHHTLITAYVAVGRREDAAQLLGELEAVARPSDRRLQMAIARCRALLAPASERDERFAEATELARDHPVQAGLSRLLHARRLVLDGCTARAASLLRELVDEPDEDLLGVVRGARLSLAQLGTTAADRSVDDPIDEAPRRAPVREPMADDQPDDASTGSRACAIEVQVLGGLSVRVDGEPVTLPAGAASTTVALLALRRTVHVEELTDVLWPEASAEVARRRLRNVLTRIRQAVGRPLIARHGDRIGLSPEVQVDHHELESATRQALAMAPGPERRLRLRAVLDADGGALLPEVLYEEWTQEARHCAEVRRAAVLAALEADQPS